MEYFSHKLFILNTNELTWQTQSIANRVQSDPEWIESDENEAVFDNNDRVDLRFNYGLISLDVVKITQTFRFDKYIFNLLWLDCRWTYNQWNSCGRLLSTRPITWIGFRRKNYYHWGLSLWFRKSASYRSIKTDFFSRTNIRGCVLLSLVCIITICNYHD